MKKRRKVCKSIFTVLLVLCLVMTGFTGSNIDLVAHATEKMDDNSNDISGNDAGSETVEEETTQTEEETTQTEEETTQTETETEESNTEVSEDRNFSDDKIDVWDFGAEELDSNTYNNRITVDDINNLYSEDIEVGSINDTNFFSSMDLDDGDFEVVSNIGKNKFMIRSDNTELTRHDSGTYGSYHGALYANAKSTSDLYMQIACKAGDAITLEVSSNGGASNIVFENVNDESDTQSQTYQASSKVEEMTFYPENDGDYKIYSSNEKLVVTRVYREHNAEQPEVREFPADNIDVWDFGAEELDSNTYNNRITVDDINNLYSDSIEVGSCSTSNNFSSMNLDNGDFEVVSECGNNKFLILSTNPLLTRYNETSYTGYQGALYANAGSTSQLYVQIACQKDDAITLEVTSNSGDSNIVFENVNDSSDYEEKTYSGGSGIATMTFYPSSDGEYKIYSSTEKLVLTRVYRAHAKYYTVSGKVDGLSNGQSCALTFTNQVTGKVVTTQVENGTYSCQLIGGYTYDIALASADGLALVSGDTITVDNQNVTQDMEVASVDLVTLTGNITGITGDELSEFIDNAQIAFSTSNQVYSPSITMKEDGTYSLSLERGTAYDIELSGVDDYELAETSIEATSDETKDIEVTKKGVYKVTIVPDGCTLEQLENATFTFTMLDQNHEETDYSYTFTGTSDIELRDGTYSVIVTGLDGYTQRATSNLVIDGTGVNKTIGFKEIQTAIPYQSVITVGSSNADYTTINDALDAVKVMERSDDQRVTIEIQPGDYQEMLVIDEPNITLKNASSSPSIDTINGGVDIAAEAVRVTSYYGHGYTYYSMGEDCKYDADVLKANQENGYSSMSNPGAGTTSGSYWNATVVVSGSGFQADGIIFENSFNQYVSELAAKDTIVTTDGAKEGNVARSDMSSGDTTVQNKSYVERAAALAMTSGATNCYFNDCKIIGRQDTLYGSIGSTDAFYNCDIYGSTDYIFGGMTAVFAKCNLVFNTSESKNDTGYITAQQTKDASDRGYLMYNCTVTSTTPGVDTASTVTSKPGYFGRPWAADTAEVVFYDTIIDATSEQYYDQTPSLINSAGWLSSLSGESGRCVEYGTYEMAENIDNSASRVNWAPMPDTAVCSDGEPISVETFLGSWTPFADHNDDMSIVMPTTHVNNSAQGTDDTDAAVVFDVTQISSTTTGDEAVTTGTGYLDNYFISRGQNILKKDDTTGSVTSMLIGKALSGSIEFTLGETANVTLVVSSTGDNNQSSVALQDVTDSLNPVTLTNTENITKVTSKVNVTLTYENLPAGSYRIVSPEDDNNRGFLLYEVTTTDEVGPGTIETEEPVVLFDINTMNSVSTDDQGVIDTGTSVGELGVVSNGNNVLKKDSNGNATSIMLGKALSGSLEFTLDEVSNISIVASSTGDTNYSSIELQNLTTGITRTDTVYSKLNTTLNYENMPAGKYRIVSPVDENNRGVLIYEIVTTKGTQAESEDQNKTTTLDVTLLEANDEWTKLTKTKDDVEYVDGYEIPDQTSFINDTFTSTGSNILKVDKKSLIPSSIELAKAEGGSLKFTLENAGDVSIVASSTSASNTSVIKLKKIDDNLVQTVLSLFVSALTLDESADNTINTTYTVSSKEHSTLTFTDLEPGTYEIVSPESETYDRGVLLYSVSVAEEQATDESETEEQTTEESTVEESTAEEQATEESATEEQTTTSSSTSSSSTSKSSSSSSHSSSTTTSASTTTTTVNQVTSSSEENVIAEAEGQVAGATRTASDQSSVKVTTDGAKTDVDASSESNEQNVENESEDGTTYQSNESDSQTETQIEEEETAKTASITTQGSHLQIIAIIVGIAIILVVGGASGLFIRRRKFGHQDK